MGVVVSPVQGAMFYLVVFLGWLLHTFSTRGMTAISQLSSFACWASTLLILLLLNIFLSQDVLHGSVQLTLVEVCLV